MPRRKCGFNSRRVLFVVRKRTAVAEAFELRCVGKSGNPPVSGTGDRRFESDHADLAALRFVCRQRGEQLIAEWPVLVSGGRLLNVSSQVRFLPPQLHGGHPDCCVSEIRGTCLENRRRLQCRLWVRVPRLPLATCPPSSSSRSLAAKASLLQSDDRGFESLRDDHILRPRGAVRSARLLVTQEIVGSSPIEDAFKQWSVVSGQWSVVSGQWSVVSGQ